MKIKYFTAIIAAALFATSCGDSAIYTAQKFVPNNGPVIENIECILPAGVSADSISNGMVIRVAVTARDPEGKPLDYTLVSEAGIFANIVKTDTGCNAELRTENITGNSSVYITVTAVDDKGASDTRANINVGTGRSGPSVGITANPRNYMKPSADTGISFKCTMEGYYQVRCDNSATAETIEINYDDPVYMYVPSGDADNPKIVNISIAGLTSTTNGRVKLPDDNAPNKVWIIFWDGLKQFDIKCYVINQDSIPPKLNAMLPAVNSEDVGVKTGIDVVFDEDIIVSNAGFDVKDSGGISVIARFGAASVSGKTMTLPSIADLDYYETYNAGAQSGFVVTDLAGNEFTGTVTDIKCTFTTQALGTLAAPVFRNADDTPVTDGSVYDYVSTRQIKAVYTGAETEVSINCSSATGGLPVDPAIDYNRPSVVWLDFSKNTGMKARAFKKGYKPSSSVSSVMVKMKSPAPVFNLTGGTYATDLNGLNVYESLSVGISGTDIKYSARTDGIIPEPPSIIYGAPMDFSGSNQKVIIRAQSKDANMELSDIATGGPWRVRSKILPEASWQITEPPLYSEHTYAPPGFNAISTDSTGQYVAAAASNGYIYTSVDFGETWTEQTDAGQRDWRGITISDSQSGTLKLTAAAYNDRIYASNGFSVAGGNCSWVAKTSADNNWISLAGSRDGIRLFAAETGGKIAYSMNSGTGWNNMGDPSSWNQVICSADGSKFLAISNDTQNVFSGAYTMTWTTALNNLNIVKDWSYVAGNNSFTNFVISFKHDTAALYSLYPLTVDGNGNFLLGTAIFNETGNQVTGLSSAYDSVNSRDKFFGNSTNWNHFYNYQNTGEWENKLNNSNFKSSILYDNGNKIYGITDYVYKGEYIAPPSSIWSFTQKTSSGSRNWKQIVSSSDGQHIYAVVGESGSSPYSVYYSGNNGISFDMLTSVGTSSTPMTIDCSSDGSVLFVATRIVRKYNSYGENYLASESNTTAIGVDYTSIACNNDGTRGYLTTSQMYFYTYDQSNITSRYNKVYTTYKYHKVICAKNSGYFIFNVEDNNKYGWHLGYSWTSGGFAYHQSRLDQTVNYKNFSISTDGTVIAFITSGYGILKYKKNGAVYNEQFIEPDLNAKSCIAVSADGSVLIYAENPGKLRISYDGGLNWFDQIYSGRRFWSCIATSYDGLKVFGGVSQQRSIVVMQ